MPSKCGHQDGQRKRSALEVGALVGIKKESAYKRFKYVAENCGDLR